MKTVLNEECVTYYWITFMDKYFDSFKDASLFARKLGVQGIKHSVMNQDNIWCVSFADADQSTSYGYTNTNNPSSGAVDELEPKVTDLRQQLSSLKIENNTLRTNLQRRDLLITDLKEQSKINQNEKPSKVLNSKLDDYRSRLAREKNNNDELIEKLESRDSRISNLKIEIVSLEKKAKHLEVDIKNLVNNISLSVKKETKKKQTELENLINEVNDEAKELEINRLKLDKKARALEIKADQLEAIEKAYIVKFGKAEVEEVKVKIKDICERCSGDGGIKGGCSSCGGTGIVDRYESKGFKAKL